MKWGHLLILKLSIVNPVNLMFLAFFNRLKDLLKSGFRDAIFWMPASCVETECSFVMKDGFLFNEESGSADALDSSTSWPFAADEYVLFLFRLDESASLEFMAESFPFTVAEGCPLTMDP